MWTSYRGVAFPQVGAFSGSQLLPFRPADIASESDSADALADGRVRAPRASARAAAFE